MRHTKPVNVTKAAIDVCNFRVSVRVCFVFLWGTCTITRTRRQGLQVFVSLGLNSFSKGKESNRGYLLSVQPYKFFSFRLASFYSMVY